MGATFSPVPRLRFEYVPGGSLEQHKDLSSIESAQVLCQLSSALEYLHNRNPSIGHRDIKPDNILVDRRTADGIRVKFADFGLSKASDVLQTCCGTWLYAAPEIYIKLADPVGAAKDTYGVSVDIWSLGVVVAWLRCGLPSYENEWMTDAVGWIHAVQAHVQDQFRKTGDEILYLLWDNMLVEDPDERSSADYITIEASRICEALENQSSHSGVTTPILSAVGVRESSRLDEHSESDDMFETTEGRKWYSNSDRGNGPKQIGEKQAASLHKSMVVDFLRNVADLDRANSARTTTNESSRATSINTVQAHMEEPQEEEQSTLSATRCVRDDEELKCTVGDAAADKSEPNAMGRSRRKRGWPQGNLRTSLSPSISCQSAASQRGAISRERPNLKRSRSEGKTTLGGVNRQALVSGVMPLA